MAPDEHSDASVMSIHEIMGLVCTPKALLGELMERNLKKIGLSSYD